MDRLTLRFVDPRKEEGFARTHKAELCHYLALAMAAMSAIGLLTSLTAHRFWDDDQYPTTEAQELSRWQMLIHMVIILSLILAFGSGRLLAKWNLVSTLGLEIIVVSASTCFMILMVIIPKHYMARVFGYDDTEAIWGVDLGGTDGNVVLYIDCVVTALHLLLPIRWVVLVPMEVIAVLAYTVPALLLGSPAMNMVPYNVIGLLVLTVFAAIGKRAFERQERALFAGLLAEKQMRFQAEFQLSKVDISSEISKDANDDRGSERSAAFSRPGTTMSEAAFDGNAELDQIRAIGNREQWLIDGGDVKLLPDRVLGEGGFGIVVAGMYHNTLVAIKAPREAIMRKGAMSSCLPELCNELRILRRIRHPNIAVMYGACMDATQNKLCLVLEFVDGVPLGVFVRGLSQLPGKLASRSRGAAEGTRDGNASARSLIVFDVLNVLRFLHSRQPVVVHGDLKDSNVFVEERRSKSGRSSYHAKLLDFGLSRLLTRNARPLGGTLRWMAPELLARKAVPPDAAADCYSFGLLAYFIVTGCLPFEDMGKEQVLSRLRRGQRPGLAWPTFADELTQACQPVVEQCTQPKPSLRPSAQQVSDELSMVLDHFTRGAMEQVVETVGIRRSGSGSKMSPGDTADTAPGNEIQELVTGLVGVSRVASSSNSSSASVGSLVPGRGSRNLPPVQEHEVLLSEEAPDVSGAVSCSSAESAHEQLTHPQYKRTPLSTQTLSLAYLLAQWNVPAPANSCCWLHGALRSLDKSRRQLQRRPCNIQQASIICAQCDSCGLLIANGDTGCEFCEVPEISVSIDESACSHGALAV